MMEDVKDIAIKLLTDSEDDCQIYANESRLIDFTRGVELARQELLRWRSTQEELPNNNDTVLIKPNVLVGIVVDVALYHKGYFITSTHNHTIDNIGYWRPIEGIINH